MIVMMNDALREALDGFLSAQGAILYFLFQNDFVPLATSVLGDFTPCDFNGYLDQLAGTFAASSIVGARARSDADQLTWTKAAGGTGNDVYGYGVQDSAGNLIWAERFSDAPLDMTTDGRQIILQTRLETGQLT